jgi:hypothetical protein
LVYFICIFNFLCIFILFQDISSSSSFFGGVWRIYIYFHAQSVILGMSLDLKNDACIYTHFYDLYVILNPFASEKCVLFQLHLKFDRLLAGYAHSNLITDRSVDDYKFSGSNLLI